MPSQSEDMAKGLARIAQLNDGWRRAAADAIGTIADEKLTPGTVAHVVGPGYGPHEEILRPAAVVVATRND